MPSAHCLVVFLALVVCRITDGDGDFEGGSISFSVRNDSGKMFADLDILTGWVLQRGPCGKNCSEADMGKTTNSRRSAIETAARDSIYFGNWTAEYKINRNTYFKDLTTILQSNMKEVVVRMDTEAKWEQELMKVAVELEAINTRQNEDIRFHGAKWHIQAKVNFGVRSDTGVSNTSPLLFMRPVYRIILNQINKIQIAVIDPDNDFIKCKRAQGSATSFDIATHSSPGVRIYENCTVIIDANETQYGYYDGERYGMAFEVRDYSKQDIKQGGNNRFKYSDSLSTVMVQFVVQVLAHVDGPIFVKPTLDSNHHVILYTGVEWRQRVYAKAVENKTIAEFIAIGRELEHLNVTAIQDGNDPRVRFVEITWIPTGIDTEHHIFCITAVDNTGVTSNEDMCFTIETRLERFKNISSPVTDRPYFINVPAYGQIVECEIDVTCVLPLYIKSAVVIKGVLVSRTSFEVTETGPITVANINGESVYQSDLSFRHTSAGHLEICVIAVDIKGEQSARTCIQAKLDPPDPCMSSPCRNSGRCSRSDQDPNQYSCHCSQYISGKNCEIIDSLCSNNPCSHGVCYDMFPGDYFCDCSSTGYMGYNCSIPSSNCHKDGCIHGVCQSFVLSSHCVCDPGYVGQRCETKSP